MLPVEFNEYLGTLDVRCHKSGSVCGGLDAQRSDFLVPLSPVQLHKEDRGRIYELQIQTYISRCRGGTGGFW